MTFNFELPLPPTTNHFHVPVRMGKHTRLVTSGEVKKYQRQVKRILDDLFLSNRMITDDIEICLTIHPKHNRRFDCSNYLKAYEDALEKCGFIENDSQISYGYIKKGEPIKGGLLKVIAKVINP